jgi:transposase
MHTLHRARQRMVITGPPSSARSAASCSIAASPSPSASPVRVGRSRSDLENELTAMAREAITIDCVFRGNEDCQRIAKIKGVGPKTATAIVAAVGDGSEFKNGRHLAAWGGVVPRQHSSGERKVLMVLQAREPAPAKPARSRRPRRRANGSEQDVRRLSGCR